VRSSITASKCRPASGVSAAVAGARQTGETRRYARLTDRTREEEYFRALARIEGEESMAIIDAIVNFRRFLKRRNYSPHTVKHTLNGMKHFVVAVKTPGDKPRFAALRQVPQVGRHDLKGMAQECLVAAATVRTDGWRAYRVLAEVTHRHEPVMTGSGKPAMHLSPWVHTLIAKVKGNIRGGLPWRW